MVFPPIRSFQELKLMSLKFENQYKGKIIPKDFSIKKKFIGVPLHGSRKIRKYKSNNINKIDLPLAS